MALKYPLQEYREALQSKALKSVLEAWKLAKEPHRSDAPPLQFYNFWFRAHEEFSLAQVKALRVAWKWYQWGLQDDRKPYG